MQCAVGGARRASRPPSVPSDAGIADFTGTPACAYTCHSARGLSSCPAFHPRRGGGPARGDRASARGSAAAMRRRRCAVARTPRDGVARRDGGSSAPHFAGIVGILPSRVRSRLRARAARDGRARGRSARDPVAVGADALSAARDRARRAQRPAGRGRGPVARAPRRRLSPGHLSVVLGRPADPVVEPRSADGAARRRVPRVALAAQARARRHVRDAHRHRFPRGHRACARTPREGQGGTWITPEMVDAYCELHRRGYAHSIESWRDGRLVGGLYGIALGRVFFGESMFAHETDASKVALVALVAQSATPRRPADRLPAGDRASRDASARGRSRGRGLPRISPN